MEANRVLIDLETRLKSDVPAEIIAAILQYRKSDGLFVTWSDDIVLKRVTLRKVLRIESDSSISYQFRSPKVGRFVMIASCLCDYGDSTGLVGTFRPVPGGRGQQAAMGDP